MPRKAELFEVIGTAAPKLRITAGFPRDKWLQDFDFDANLAVNPATIPPLATDAWFGPGSRSA